MLSDDDYADYVLESRTWRTWRELVPGFRNWEVPAIVHDALRKHADLEDASEEDFRTLQFRVVKIIRGRWADKGITTKRKRKLARATAADKAVAKVVERRQAPEFKLVGGRMNK